MADMTVKKYEYVALTAVDADGTPLEHGERMIETEPGVWISPVVAAALPFLQEAVAKLDPESRSAPASAKTGALDATYPWRPA